MTRFRPWILVCAVFAAVVVAYFFAFRAVRMAQIKEVPLTTKGGRP